MKSMKQKPRKVVEKFISGWCGHWSDASRKTSHSVYALTNTGKVKRWLHSEQRWVELEDQTDEYSAF